MCPLKQILVTSGVELPSPRSSANGDVVLCLLCVSFSCHWWCHLLWIPTSSIYAVNFWLVKWETIALEAQRWQFSHWRGKCNILQISMCKPAACLVLGQALFRLLIKCKPRALLLGLDLTFPPLSSWMAKYFSDKVFQWSWHFSVGLFCKCRPSSSQESTKQGFVLYNGKCWGYVVLISYNNRSVL